MMDAEALLPLSAPMYAVLITLGDDALHGYGVIQRFEARTGQKGALLPGSVYNTIARLLKQGLVEEVPAPSDDDDGRRRYYRATEFGREVARAETDRLRGLLSLAEARGYGGGAA